MAIPTILVDDGGGLLAPLTDLRAAFDIRTGALTNVERFGRSRDFTVIGLRTPEPLAQITRERHGLSVNEPVRNRGGEVAVVHGRWAAADPRLVSRLEPGQALVGAPTREGEAPPLLAARIDAADADRIVQGDRAGLAIVNAPESPAHRLLERPWDVRKARDAALAIDLAVLPDWITTAHVPAAIITFGQRGLFVRDTAKIYPGVTLDCEHGPIAIDDHAAVRPGAIICGPAYVGPHSTVLDRALIKGGTAIGPFCKVAGEVGGTIFQGFANKAHDGHLGDSHIGEWANLGAGTTNSNLLNTYGEVVCRGFDAAGRPGPNERTGEQFLGCIIGDHCKFAIATRIMTGAIVGTGTMWAASAPVSGTVAAFSWVTDAGVRRFGIEKFHDIARTVMARRRAAPTAAYLSQVAAMHERTGQLRVDG